MRVLILSTKGKLTGEWLAGQLQPLQRHDPEISLVVLTRPIGRLPVNRCVVVRKSLRPRRAVRVRGAARTRLSGLDQLILRVVPQRWSKDAAVLFATGTVWSREVTSMFKQSDIVIALDWNATWAAWLLAQRIPGPEVVHGVAGALHKLSGPDRVG